MAEDDGPGGAGEPDRLDIPAALTSLTERLREAEHFLGRDRLLERRTELEKAASEPGLWDDADHARRVTTELGKVSEDIELLAGLAEKLSDADTLNELIEEEDDDSLRPEVEQVLGDLDRRLSVLELRALFAGPYDDGDAVAEIHAGAGGTDAQDWAEMMLRMYTRWAERRGFGIEVEEATPGQEAGLLSATFIVKGRYAFGLLAAERGVHRLVRISPFDAQHRRQTSFASLDVVPFLEDVSDEVEIDEKDLRIDTYRSSGAGGQHVNKTDSAVRLTHLPTGIVVSCQNQRSQHQNKAKAMQVLGAKLAERQRAEHQATLDQLSGDRTDNAWGNQIRSYVLAPYQLVKDLRTNEETGNVEAVLDGDLDAFVEAELRRGAELRRNND
ncbi:MAG TPA: peptide chain release factor 2 [Acidimicrobiales bacterium]|nr:peptide chain release factor 2 [Acidimicrobiales bacterium]